MGNNLSFFEKEGGNYDYICKTIEQKENGVIVKPIIKQMPQELNINSEKPIKKRNVHIINQKNFPSCKAKRYEENNNSNSSINKKSKNSSVKFSKKNNNIENSCLNMNTINTNLINKGLIKGVINRNYIKSKKTFFTNDLLSCYNNNHILNNNSVNNSFTTEEYIINDDKTNPPFNILPVIKTLNTNPYNRKVLINS